MEGVRSWVHLFVNITPTILKCIFGLIQIFFKQIIRLKIDYAVQNKESKDIMFQSTPRAFLFIMAQEEEDLGGHHAGIVER